MHGTISEPGPDTTGAATVKIDAKLPAAAAVLHVVIRGTPLANGGVNMSDGLVRLGVPGTPDLYRGPIISLDGTNIVAQVSDASGATLVLNMRLVVDDGSHTVGGTVTARQGVSSGGN